jgi:hypothetical protein
MSPLFICAGTFSVHPSTLTKEQDSLGYHIATDHGPLASLLLFLGLDEQLKMSNTCKRAYDITLPWNMRPVLLPLDPPCDFPNLRISSKDHVIKRVKATIKGEKGEFFGIVRKSSGIPDGCGVFRTSDWVHCGQVKNGAYQQGKKVSVNATEKLLKMTNKKLRVDGIVLEKIELFTQQD